MYTIVLVNVKRFRALCGFYAIENKLLLYFSPLSIARYSFIWSSELGRRGENENIQGSKR